MRTNPLDKGKGVDDAQGTGTASRDSSEFGRMLMDFNQRDGKVHSSFRISPLVDVLGPNLSLAKQRILRRMRFDGLMKLPQDDSETYSPFKLRFAFTIMLKIDSVSRDLNLGERGVIHMTDEDVELVLGLPCWGDHLEVHDPSKLDTHKAIIRRNLMLEENEDIDLENIRKVLQRGVPDSTDHPISKAFMTAVVIYAVSCFLAPKGRPPKVNTEIFDSIVNPDRILKLNWSAYVLKTLRESSGKIKADILAGKSSVCLDGCLLFLQILYLDNIKAGACTTTQYRCPRVADFSYTKLNELISMDEQPGARDKYGACELRNIEESFYTTGLLYRHMLDKSEAAFRKLPSEYDLDKVIAYIDEENLVHKNNILKHMEDYANDLCTLSDKHCDEVKNIVTRWTSVSICKERGTACEGLESSGICRKLEALRGWLCPKDTGGQSHNETKSHTHAAGESSSKHGEAGDKRFGKQDGHTELVDLSGRVDEDGISKKDCTYSEEGNKKQSGGEQDMALGQRQGTKTTANRTPLAIRRAEMECDLGEPYSQLGFNDNVEQLSSGTKVGQSRQEPGIRSTLGMARGGSRKQLAHKRLKVTKKVDGDSDCSQEDGGKL